tara:strand:- start:7459 stop:8511 length:1053 start_codon:yes stop_codon:yes gene_type:complete
MALIRARAPLRISFGGGGTEIDPYRSNYGGEVLNTTIGLYAYTNIEEIDKKNIIRFIASDLNINEEYDKNEIINDDNLNKSNLKIHLATLRFIIGTFKVKIKNSLKIITYCDAPVGSGLGSSSTLTVSMLEAYNSYFKLGLSKYEIAKKSYFIERKQLGLHGGQQDQFSASFGGFNYIYFKEDGKVTLEPLEASRSFISEFEASLILAYTGISRNSAKIIESQIQRDVSNDLDYIGNLNNIKKLAKKMRKSFENQDIITFGNLLHESWINKRTLSKLITSSQIDDLYDSVRNLGAYGGKISGAGGGGFFMILCDPINKGKIINRLVKMNNIIFPAKFSSNGAESWQINNK